MASKKIQILSDYVYQEAVKFYCPADHAEALNVEKRDECNFTLLFWAVICSQSDSVILALLQSNYDINAVSNSGSTPLMFAVMYGNERLVNLLIEHQAALNVINNYGLNPMIQAALFGHPDIVRILYRHGENFNVRGICGGTALFAAAQNNQMSIVLFMLEHGADYTLAYTNTAEHLKEFFEKHNFRDDNRLQEYITESGQTDSKTISVTSEKMAWILGHEDIFRVLEARRLKDSMKSSYTPRM
jgi:ankyrin repeat protein